MTSKENQRQDIVELEDIPNIGVSIADDLRSIGIEHPQQLIGRDPYQLYDRLCSLTQVRHDPCVIDCFISAVRFMEGAPKRPWWHYTPERKTFLSQTESSERS